MATSESLSITSSSPLSSVDENMVADLPISKEASTTNATTANNAETQQAQNAPSASASTSTSVTTANTTTTPTQSAATTTTPMVTPAATVPVNNNVPTVIQPPPPTSTTSFEEIQKQLKATLDHVEQRNMVSGFQTLSKATSAVVDHCEQLGLTSDDHPYNAIDREQFWAGLNNCWLYALAQRQEPSSEVERMTDQHLYGLREMVVAWADKLERYGLVDYEMGWWEADILAAIDAILAMNYAAAQAAAQAVVAQAAAALFGEDVLKQQ
ncbi:hypothetical protein RO3G_02211 [Lichtheimia corymbifera JMRC:FSU:9682]|uniref:Uncharacterized protein n=1 Tax=Lichtheimia corymbifera JMRC:FSU:9682 TaxID=1263082 RepID=A0A068RSM6_9FUNG|nr:hypothetical protein RO3G_02211 [Lichtheimia corymbifera JMRC:FSU:9682]